MEQTKNFDWTNIPTGEIYDTHVCKTPKPQGIYKSYRMGKAPHTGDYVLYAHGYLITCWYCIYCGEQLRKDE